MARGARLIKLRQRGNPVHRHAAPDGGTADRVRRPRRAAANAAGRGVVVARTLRHGPPSMPKASRHSSGVMRRPPCRAPAAFGPGPPWIVPAVPGKRSTSAGAARRSTRSAAVERPDRAMSAPGTGTLSRTGAIAGARRAAGPSCGEPSASGALSHRAPQRRAAHACGRCRMRWHGRLRRTGAAFCIEPPALGRPSAAAVAERREIPAGPQHGRWPVWLERLRPAHTGRSRAASKGVRSAVSATASGTRHGPPHCRSWCRPASGDRFLAAGPKHQAPPGGAAVRGHCGCARRCSISRSATAMPRAASGFGVHRRAGGDRPDRACRVVPTGHCGRHGAVADETECPVDHGAVLAAERRHDRSRCHMPVLPGRPLSPCARGAPSCLRPPLGHAATLHHFLLVPPPGAAGEPRRRSHRQAAGPAPDNRKRGATCRTARTARQWHPPWPAARGTATPSSRPPPDQPCRGSA